ncbi:hypothetical protein, partial [Haloplasma contractile]
NAAQQMRSYARGASNYLPTSGQNQTPNYMTEYATGYAKRGYNAMGQEAKSGTKAAQNAYKGTPGQSNYSQEFGTGFGAMSQMEQQNSKQAAQQMRNYTPNQNSMTSRQAGAMQGQYSQEFGTGFGASSMSKAARQESRNAAQRYRSSNKTNQ